MKKSWLLAFGLCFVLIASFAMPVSAKAEIQHGVYHDVDSESEWSDWPLPEEWFPYTAMRVHSHQSWVDHVIYHVASDGRGGYHEKLQFSHQFNSKSQTWLYDSVNDEWVDVGRSSWSVTNRNGFKGYATEAELKQGMAYYVVRNVVKVDYSGPTPPGWIIRPSEDRIFEFHYISKFLDGKLHFFKILKSPVRLTGVIYDRGVDTDDNGAYNYLEIEVEFRVDNPGYCYIIVYDLRDNDYNYIYATFSAGEYLDAGTHIVNLRFSGGDIHQSGINPSHIGQVSISYYDYSCGESAFDTLLDVSLSRTYYYTEFDAPGPLGAYLTGTITDQGVDADFPPDGTFDYLEIGVEVEVSEVGTYTVETDGLLDDEGNPIWVWSRASMYLETGTQVIYLQLDGYCIYDSGLNPSRVSVLRLFDDRYRYLEDISDLPLSTTYLYTQFDAPLPPPTPTAILTGVTTDEGIDTDGNGSFNYLEIGVEVEAYEAGYYHVSLHYLLDEEGNLIWVWSDNSTYLVEGTQFIYLRLDGPTINAQGLNPRYVLSIYLWDEYWNYQSFLERVPLSKEYSYTEFDAPPPPKG